MKLINVHLCGYSYHREPFHHLFENGLDTYIIRLQSEGASRVVIDGRLVELVPGDLLFFRPGDVYDLRIAASGERPSGDYFIIGVGEGLDEWWSLKTRPKKASIAEDGRVKALWHQLNLEKRRLDGGDPEIVTLLARSILSLLDRAVEEAPDSRSTPAFHALRMRNYIEEHAASPLRLSEVARDCGLSVSRAVHLFKEHFGVSIIGYVQQIRLAHAHDLMLHSTLSLEQIAADAGLGSYAYFHRIFRARYGLSPGAYRKQHLPAALDRPLEIEKRS